MWESFDWERLLFLSLLVICVGGALLLIVNRIGHKSKEKQDAGAAASAAQIPTVTLVPCPACNKQVSNYAGACPSCGHPLAQPAQNAAPRKWNRGVAALLSFIIPGAGQMYKGHVVAGILWFAFVIAGYFILIIPGIVLHLICIFSAASGD